MQTAGRCVCVYVQWVALHNQAYEETGEIRNAFLTQTAPAHTSDVGRGWIYPVASLLSPGSGGSGFNILRQWSFPSDSVLVYVEIN